MMYCKQIRRSLVGLLLAIAAIALAPHALAQSSAAPDRPRDRDSRKTEVQTGTLVALDALGRAEQRVEALRARLLETQMKEMELQDRLDDLDYQLRPERIQQALAFVGSVRPMDELRYALRVRLENLKARVNKQLELLVENRERLEASITEAEMNVERLRQQLDPL
jgi:phage shock protein A